MVGNNDSEFLQNRMPEETAAHERREVWPLAFGASSDVDTDDPSARVHEPLKRFPLPVVLKDVVVAVAEHDGLVALQIGIGEQLRIFGSIDIEAVGLAERADRLDAGCDVVMNVAFAVAGEDKNLVVWLVGRERDRHHRKADKRRQGAFHRAGSVIALSRIVSLVDSRRILMALTWWLWLLAGSVLLGLEIITPGGFYVFFFGIGAIVVGLLAAAGIAGPVWMQWLLFGVISIAALALFRRPLLRKFSVSDRPVDTMVGEVAVALADIQADGIGKAELRGSVWTARNEGPVDIAAGQRCRVQRIEGLTLHVRA